jgi:hypothetical protein
MNSQLLLDTSTGKRDHFYAVLEPHQLGVRVLILVIRCCPFLIFIYSCTHILEVGSILQLHILLCLKFEPIGKWLTTGSALAISHRLAMYEALEANVGQRRSRCPCGTPTTAKTIFDNAVTENWNEAIKS